MKTYQLYRHPDSQAAQVLVRPSGSPLDPGPSQKVFNHSPDGFEWGYSGSGPSQLALALLLDATDEPHVSLDFHQDFKADFLTDLPREGGLIPEATLKGWIYAKLTKAGRHEEADRLYLEGHIAP